MDVDWNEEEKHDLGFTLSGHAGGNTLAAAMAVGSRAVDLVRARGGTMTAERVEETLVAVTQANQPRAALRDLLGQHITAQGATAATLQAKVEELEEERGKDAERIRDIERAKNLADHLYNEEHEAKIALRAEVERLEARTWIQCTVISNDCLGGCRSLEEHDRYRHQALLSEGDRLKDDLESAREDVATNQRVIAEEVEKRMAAESRLAAIRERAKTYGPETFDLPISKAELRWVLGGDTPQEVKANGSLVIGDDGAPVLLTRDGTRYPCSATCTHEDAANPGHPERIESLSVAFDKPMPGTGAISSDEPLPERVEERSEAVIATANLNDGHPDALPQGPLEVARMAAVDDVAALAKAAGAKNEREVSSFRVGYEKGAEDMRAALLIEAKAACDQHGVGWLYQHLKRRFDGATT